MRKILFCLPIIIISTIHLIHGQKIKTDANIVGHVVSGGKHIPFVSIVIKGTSIGTLTDETGHYQLIHVPVGEVTLSASAIGYQSAEKTVLTEADKTVDIKFELNEDVLHLEEVVVSADRGEQKRKDAPVIISTIPQKLFTTSHSFTLGEGLNYTPGLRLENNCQNCGFSQVRMNGMEGPYSQILINSRPVFSGLAGVYGLELIPANMIKKVEVVRGGGSAMYGSNAIAGTINIILKEPLANTYKAGADYALTGVGVDGSGGSVVDYKLSFNTSLLSSDHKTGISLYGFNREREMFDANNDGFSEIAPINNLTLGTRFFHRFGYRDKVAVDFFSIKEQRDGGNKQDYPLHERDIAESLTHNFKVGSITYEQFLRDYDLLTVFASGQFLDRDSYYGAARSLSDYGNSRDRTYNTGIQYKAVFKNSSIITGIENTGDFLIDKKLGYPDYDNAEIVNDSVINVPHTENITIANQSSITSGVFVQYELEVNKAKIAAGARYDNFKIKDRKKEGESPKTGRVFSPRINLMYKIHDVLSARLSYSQGYRAPQIYDEDLHIETSGARKVIHKNDPGLNQETSHSIMASLDLNGMIGTIHTGFLVEGFHTQLINPFVNDPEGINDNRVIIYTRTNSEGSATVQGMNMELKIKPLRILSFTSGFTLQSSKYEKPQELFNETKFFRTPDNYGFFAMDWIFAKKFCLAATGNYTGSMLVPYFGPETDPETGELHKSDQFFDLGLRLRHNIKLNGAKLQWNIGVRNILNSYQSDFDTGIDRDPAYMYGPVVPRTIYFGINISNLLNEKYR